MRGICFHQICDTLLKLNQNLQNQVYLKQIILIDCSKDIISVLMINNFLIIDCIGVDDKLGLGINKDFFIHKICKKKIITKTCFTNI